MDHCEISFLFTTTCAPSNNNVSDVESYTNVNVIQKDCMWSNECGLQQEALDLLDVNNNTLNTIAYTKPDEETGSLYNYQEDDLQELQLPVQALVDKCEDDSTDNIADCCQTGRHTFSEDITYVIVMFSYFLSVIIRCVETKGGHFFLLL